MTVTGKALRDAVHYWKGVLGLDDWIITIQIGRMPDGDYGSALVSIPYKKAHLRFYPKGIQQAGETVDQLACHELLHCVVEPLAEYALGLSKSPGNQARCEELEEGLVTELERLVLRLHKRPRSD